MTINRNCKEYTRTQLYFISIFSRNTIPSLNPRSTRKQPELRSKSTLRTSSSLLQIVRSRASSSVWQCHFGRKLACTITVGLRTHVRTCGSTFNWTQSDCVHSLAQIIISHTQQIAHVLRGSMWKHRATLNKVYVCEWWVFVRSNRKQIYDVSYWRVRTR